MYNWVMSQPSLERAAEIINQIQYITIASVSADGKPWNSPVYSAFDKDLNFYWASDKDSQHSTNLLANGEAFIVIYDSTVPEGTGKGVYIQARVRMLTDEAEALAALRVLDARVGKIKERDFQKFSSEAPLRVFQATPEKIWMNADAKDENNNYIKDTRVELPLPSLKQLI